MKIVIAGAGEVGTHLAKMLGNEYHDITIIDESSKNLEKIGNMMDMYPIVGDPVDINTLISANIGKANLFISVCPEESKNILAATLAKHLGAKKCIARIDNDEYLKPNNKEIFISMGIDYMFYPEKIAAAEITNLLGNTSTTEYVNFSNGRLVLVVFRLSANSPIVNKTLIEVTSQLTTLDYRTVAISRGGNTIIPRGNDMFMENDTIYVIATRKHLDEVMALSGTPKIRVKNVMILGGGLIGERVAATIQNQMNVKLVEYNEEQARKLAGRLDNTLVINQDGRNAEVMHDEELERMDAFVAVTGRSETNILAAMLAKKMGVKKVIADIENFNYIGLAESMGIDTIINKKQITASNIFRFTMNTDVQAIKCLNGCDAEVLEFIAKPDSPVTKKAVKDIEFPEGAIIGGVVRGDDMVFIATGESRIKPYDRVVVFALPEAISRMPHYFD